MNLSNYYYHTLLKDSISNDEIYNNLELILKDGYIKSKKLLSGNTYNSYNGDEYISLASYQENTSYKVPHLEKKDYENSKMKELFSSYKKYLKSLEEYEYLEEPLTKEAYFKKYNTETKRDYYNYLDKITRTYPVDIKTLYENTQDEIYKEILNISNKEIIYCYPSENTFTKYVLETKGITFIFDKNITTEKVTIIPNLPFEIEDKLVSKLKKLNTRYSNLIGEVQVKNKISINDAIGIIIKNNLDKNKVKDLLKKYNHNMEVYIMEKEKIIEDNEKYFYHVVTNKPMYVGQKISFTETNQSGVYKRVMEKESLVKDIYLHPENYKQEDLEHHTKVALRELAMEEIRQKYYPNYPSRIKSLYVSTDLNDSYMWTKSFTNKGRVVYQIVKLKTTGNSFTGNAYNCFEGTTDKEYNLKESFKYWDNIIEDESKIIYETIIDGEIEVVEIIEDFDK